MTDEPLETLSTDAVLKVQLLESGEGGALDGPECTGCGLSTFGWRTDSGPVCPYCRSDLSDVDGMDAEHATVLAMEDLATVPDLRRADQGDLRDAGLSAAKAARIKADVGDAERDGEPIETDDERAARIQEELVDTGINRYHAKPTARVLAEKAPRALVRALVNDLNGEAWETVESRRHGFRCHCDQCDDESRLQSLANDLKKFTDEYTDGGTLESKAMGVERRVRAMAVDAATNDIREVRRTIGDSVQSALRETLVEAAEEAGLVERRTRSDSDDVEDVWEWLVTAAERGEDGPADVRECEPQCGCDAEDDRGEPGHDLDGDSAADHGVVVAAAGDDPTGVANDLEDVFDEDKLAALANVLFNRHARTGDADSDIVQEVMGRLEGAGWQPADVVRETVKAYQGRQAVFCHDEPCDWADEPDGVTCGGGPTAHAGDIYYACPQHLEAMREWLADDHEGRPHPDAGWPDHTGDFEVDGEAVAEQLEAMEAMKEQAGDGDAPLPSRPPIEPIREWAEEHAHRFVATNSSDHTPESVAEEIADRIEEHAAGDDTHGREHGPLCVCDTCTEADREWLDIQGELQAAERATLRMPNGTDISLDLEEKRQDGTADFDVWGIEDTDPGDGQRTFRTRLRLFCDAEIAGMSDRGGEDYTTIPCGCGDYAVGVPESAQPEAIDVVCPECGNHFGHGEAGGRTPSDMWRVDDRAGHDIDADTRGGTTAVDDEAMHTLEAGEPSTTISDGEIDEWLEGDGEDDYYYTVRAQNNDADDQWEATGDVPDTSQCVLAMSDGVRLLLADGSIVKPVLSETVHRTVLTGDGGEMHPYEISNTDDGMAVSRHATADGEEYAVELAFEDTGDRVVGDVEANTLSTAPRLDPAEYRALLDLLMCSDPYPCDGEEAIKSLAGSEAEVRGWDSWVEAYHEHQPPGGDVHCPAEGPRGMSCEKPAGHDGAHARIEREGGEHTEVRWEDKQ